MGLIAAVALETKKLNMERQAHSLSSPPISQGDMPRFPRWGQRRQSCEPTFGLADVLALAPPIASMVI